MIRQFGSSPSDRLLTPSIDVSVVDHLAVGRRHRVSEPGDPRLLDRLGHTAGEPLEGGAALLPVAGDVDPQAGLVIAESTLGAAAGQVLDRQQRAAPDRSAGPSPLGPS
jgi:hypothetical protein